MINGRYAYYVDSLALTTGGTVIGIGSESAEYDTLYGNSIGFWIASSYTRSNTDGAYFGIRASGKGVIGTFNLYYSYGGQETHSSYIRPVVSLDSNIRLLDNDEDGIFEIVK